MYFRVRESCMGANEQVDRSKQVQAVFVDIPVYIVTNCV
jgi:hypothetical protein